MTEFFNELPPSGLDPIMQANAVWPVFRRNHDHPINTTIGVLGDPRQPIPWRPFPVRRALYQAQETIDEQENYGYQTPAGHQGFLNQTRRFIYGDEVPDDLLTYQSMGGTGDLSLTNDALSQLQHGDSEGKRTLLIDSGWPNHSAVFQKDFSIQSYSHVDFTKGTYNHEASLAAIEESPRGSTALFQVCGYNDDGIDRTHEQWDEVLDAAFSNEMVVILDAAYIGLAEGVAHDAYPLKAAADKGLLTFSTISFSKNMGLYNERLGALHIANADFHLGQTQTENLHQTVLKAVRRTISSPPLHVAAAAELVLQDQEYSIELEQARRRLFANRIGLAIVLGSDFPAVKNGRGLFTKLLADGFSENQLSVLENEGILALPNSRLNIGGIRLSQIERVGEAILKAIKTK